MAFSPDGDCAGDLRTVPRPGRQGLGRRRRPRAAGPARALGERLGRGVQPRRHRARLDRRRHDPPVLGPPRRPAAAGRDDRPRLDLPVGGLRPRRASDRRRRPTSCRSSSWTGSTRGGPSPVTTTSSTTWPSAPAARSWPRRRPTTASSSGTWKAGAGRVIRPSGDVHAHQLAYAPDGTWLAIGPLGNRGAAPGATSPSLPGWSTPTRGGSIPPGRARWSDASALAVDRSGRRIAAGSEDGAAIVWDVATRAAPPPDRAGASGPIGRVPPRRRRRRPRPCSPRRREGRAVLVGLAGGKLREATIAGDPVAFAVSPDGDRLAAGSPDGSIRTLPAPGPRPARDRGAGPRREGRRRWPSTPMAGSWPRRATTAAWSSATPARSAPSSRSPPRWPCVNALAFSPDGASPGVHRQLGRRHRLGLRPDRLPARRPRPRLGHRIAGITGPGTLATGRGGHLDRDRRSRPSERPSDPGGGGRPGVRRWRCIAGPWSR